MQWNIYSRLCNITPHKTVLCLFPSQHWHSDSGMLVVLSGQAVPQATEVLNHHVFALLKFHSTWAEIWSVKNCHFHLPCCIPEGNSGRWPKPTEHKNPIAEQWSGASGNGLCWECLGLRGHSRRWLAWGKEQQHHFLCPHPLLWFIFFLSPTVKSWGHSSQALGEEGSTLAHCWGMAGKCSKREQETGKTCPPHLDHRHLEHLYPLYTASPPFR